MCTWQLIVRSRALQSARSRQKVPFALTLIVALVMRRNEKTINILESDEARLDDRLNVEKKDKPSMPPQHLPQYILEAKQNEEEEETEQIKEQRYRRRIKVQFKLFYWYFSSCILHPFFSNPRSWIMTCVNQLVINSPKQNLVQVRAYHNLGKKNQLSFSICKALVPGSPSDTNICGCPRACTKWHHIYIYNLCTSFLLIEIT